MCNFIEKCLSHEAGYDDIDDFVEQWHQRPEGKSVYDFLGMTRQEYALWVADPSVLPTIISVHAQNLNLDEIFKESAREASSTSMLLGHGVKEQLDWLKASELWKSPSAE